MKLPGLHTPARAGGSDALRHEAESAAARLPSLMVAAERIAVTVAQGVHGRRRVGPGETFWQYRRYQPGDSAQAIDWRQSAKTQAAFVRETEWEAAQSVWLWQDRSQSMAFTSEAGLPEKRDRAAVIALALAILLVRGGERVALLGRGMPPSTGRAAVNRVATLLVAPPAEGESLPPLEALPRFARLVLLGDFLTPPAELEPVVRAYAARGVHGHILQVLDAAEDTLPFSGRVRFEGLEGEGAALIGRVERVRDDYVALMQSHRAALADIARRVGWGFTVHRTASSPQAALLALYGALADSRAG